MTPPPPNTSPLNELTIADIQQQFAAGTLTSVQLTNHYIQRVRQLDPQLHAIITLKHEAALQLAHKLDAERHNATTQLSPLHGIPIIFKDNLTTNDMPTSAGSRIFRNHVSSKDSAVATRLRQSGAILLAKTALPEFANARSWTGSCNSYNPVSGQCRNPYALDRSPSGSSSGTACGVAANLATAGIGTETGGSLTHPASVCGCVSLRPTMGLVSRAGILPISMTQDTAGPITRTVNDTAILLSVIAGSDPLDPVTAEADTHKQSDYTQYSRVDGLKGKRIGILRTTLKPNRYVNRWFEQAVAVLQHQGAVLVDNLQLWKGESEEYKQQFYKAMGEVISTDMKHDLEQYLRDYAPDNEHGIRTMLDIVDYNNKHADVELRDFDQSAFEDMVTRGSKHSEVYKQALQTCQTVSREQGIDQLLKDSQLDVLCCPTSTAAHVLDQYATSEPIEFTELGMVASVAGYPHLTVPMSSGPLPVGLSFVAGKWQEPLLLEVGYAYEQATKHRRAPEFKATLPLRTNAAET